MKLVKTIRSWLTMKQVCVCFIDAVSGKEVFTYVDCYGKYWMAYYPRWFFRVEKI